MRWDTDTSALQLCVLCRATGECSVCSSSASSPVSHHIIPRCSMPITGSTLAWLSTSLLVWTNLQNSNEVKPYKHNISLLHLCSNLPVHAAFFYWCHLFSFQKVLIQTFLILNDLLINRANWQPSITHKSFECPFLYVQWLLTLMEQGCYTLKPVSDPVYHSKSYYC